jgi:hypothetical protein
MSRDRVAALLSWNKSQRLISLWIIMKEYMQPYAAIVAHELVLFEHLEGVMEKWEAQAEVSDDFLALVGERANAAQKIVSILISK